MVQSAASRVRERSRGRSLKVAGKKDAFMKRSADVRRKKMVADRQFGMSAASVSDGIED